jgi:hypothetical protein
LAFLDYSVIVGIIFGIITAKIKKLHITNIRKGITLGLATGDFNNTLDRITSWKFYAKFGD